MPRTCTICTHSDRQAIDRAIVAGESAPTIAAKYRVSDDAILRHSAEHLPERMTKAADAREQTRADVFLEQVAGLRNKAVKVLVQAETAGDLKTALLAIREDRACIELLLEV